MDGENLVKSLNKNGKNVEIDIQVITLDDNLNHPYFSLIEISKDNFYPIGIGKLEAPYTPYISDYWIKYSGVVVISFNIADLKQQNTNSLKFLESNDIKKRIVNDEYNYSFICKVSRFKQEGNKFIIYLEDLGWKFLQKVPPEFRKTYIAGQYLDDAFQAICEFLGVQFAYSIEDLHEYSFSTDGYSVEKDGTVIEDVPSILTEWGPEKEEEDPLDDPLNEDPGLLDFIKKNKGKSKSELKEAIEKKRKELEQRKKELEKIKNSANNNNNNQNNSNDNKTNTEDTTNEQNEQLDLEEKILKYQEEFDQKVLDLFIGNTYYESDLTSSVMDYGSITITPRAVQSNDANAMMMAGGTTSGATDENSGGESSEGGSSEGSGTVGAPGVWGQTSGGSYYLTKEAINAMSPQEAHQRYLDGKSRNIYTSATMQKLFQRSCWLPVW